MSVINQMQKFLNASDVAMGKILAQEGITFKEYRKLEGIVKEVSHIALPVTISNQDKLMELVNQEAKAEQAYREKVNPIQVKLSEALRKIGDMKDEDILKPENKKLIAKSSKLAEEMKDITSKEDKVLMDIRLDIAQLVFSRTEDITKEEIKSWIDPQQLQLFSKIAQGITFPPKA